jgi:Chromo (CHRromatin Organisation MOdifier) domain
MAEFACNNAPNASTGMTPFHVNYGRDPYNPYSAISKIPDEVPAMAEFLEGLSNSTKIASDALVLAKANQEKHANKSRRDVHFQVGDQVLLSASHINLASQAQRPTKKLQHRFLGPYKILQKVSSVAYRLDLPDSLRIHPVFHVSLLRAYKDPASFPDRPPPDLPPPPVTINDAPEYVVERILDHRTHRRRLEYLVKWAGYPDHDASWEPLEHLANSQEILRDYEASRTMPEGGESNVTEPPSQPRSRDQPDKPRTRNST